MATPHERAEERGALVYQMRKLVEGAEADNGRDMNAEEQAEFDSLNNRIDELEAADAEDRRAKEATAKAKERLAGLRAAQQEVRNPAAPQDLPKDEKKEELKAISERLEEAMSLGADRKEALQSIIKSYSSSEEMGFVRRAARQFITRGTIDADLRDRAALQVDSDSAGGTMVMPEDFIARLIQGLDERVFMRQISTVLPMTNADSIGVPSLENDPADADWTSELLIGGEDTTMDTGKRKLHPHPCGKLLKVSKTLLRKSAIPADALVRERLTFKFGVTEEKAFLTGSGSNQPLGVFTASADGISTGQDVNTDNSTTDVTADGLISAKFNLASQYLASANLRWIFHRDVVRNIRKLKDGNGQYLWVNGLAGEPATILEVPYEMSEYAPNTFTTGQYVGIIGDFAWYWIAESLRFELQRLNELYAATNQVGFIGRMEADAMPVLEEAFTRVTLA